MVTDISKYIDYTLLKPDAIFDMFKKLCADAEKYKFYSVCVPPYAVKECKGFLEKSDVKITTVIGFPLGYNSTETKVFETEKAISDGADEIDAVINVSAFKSGRNDYVLKDGLYNLPRASDYVLKELKKLRKAAEKHILKIIIETCYLTKEEIVKVCGLVSESGADFIKTSTGFGSDGAKIEDIELIKKSVPENVKIKASGGVKTFEYALELIEAGVSRIGTSSILGRVNAH